MSLKAAEGHLLRAPTTRNAFNRENVIVFLVAGHSQQKSCAQTRAKAHQAVLQSTSTIRTTHFTRFCFQPRHAERKHTNAGKARARSGLYSAFAHFFERESV